jgi:UDP-N-acetylglucosamine acyltransferase
MLIHPTAIIDPSAELSADVEVGAYCVIQGQVKIGASTKIGPHVFIGQHTTIGSRNKIFQFSSIGDEPQDKKYKNEPTTLEIGDDNTIREFCTLNRGTVQDAGVTKVGNHNWIMAYVHIAHDCIVGNNVIFANNAQLAGHVKVEDFAILGGYTGAHQFCRIGAHSITAIGTILLQDLPPYVMASGEKAKPHGINSEGLKRRGFSKDAILEIKRAYKTLYKSGHSFEEAKTIINQQAVNHPELKALSDFLSISGRGVIR